MSDLLNIKNLTKSITLQDGSKKSLIRDLNLSLPFSEKGKIYSIVAPFASGKTTLLKIISGIENFDAGKIDFNNSISKVKPLIPENYSTLPWLTVEENIKVWEKYITSGFSEEKLKTLIEEVGLTNYEKYHTQSSNTGFQFRIALARAMIFNSNLILVDDSFKDFDSETRIEIYDLIKKLVNKFNFHIILATTNVIEAIYLSDKLFLMSKNPARIISEFNIDIRFDNLDTMLASKNFSELSQKIQTEFHKNSGISLLHFSV
jgi:ABC-type nitrate/sulfonate/bicarbonate transport system ATPase subunit